jgi:predicted nucleic acid-binding Zn ribbon protein
LKQPERISRIIPRVLKSLQIDEKVRNSAVVDRWPQIVGARIARHAAASAVDGENLYVTVDTPVWQGQLFLMKNEILKKIRDLGYNIKDIRLSIESSGMRKKEK